MIKQILTGSLIIILVSIIHLSATKISINLIKRSKSSRGLNRKILTLIWLDTVVLLLVLASLLESMLWAGCYIWVGAIQSFEDALYFSIVTFTTLGYGDITLNASWRILASLEAAAGIIVFGWSTAIVMTGIQNIYFVKRN